MYPMLYRLSDGYGRYHPDFAIVANPNVVLRERPGFNWEPDPTRTVSDLPAVFADDIRLAMEAGAVIVRPEKK